ncbi:MAG: hypothetical protein WC637_08085 [Victivallales bacterium]
MKKLIITVAVCMMVSVLSAIAGTADGTAGGGAGGIKGAEERLTPEQRTARIEERIKKLEEHKSKANSNGRTEVVSALQGMIDALNNLKGVIGSKDRESIKGAMEKVKTAREALMKLAPGKTGEKCNKAGGKAAGDKAGKTPNKNSL